MSAAETRADGYVAIDLGTTYTKVAFLFAADGPNAKPVVLKHGVPIESELIPTAVGYKDGKLLNIGHDVTANALEPGWDVFHRFKSNEPNASLSPINPAASDASRTTRELYIDFLKLLFVLVENEYARRCPSKSPGWYNARLHFLFTVPAAGNASRAGNTIKGAAMQAGYDKVSGHHIVSHMRTEAEASAAFTLKDMSSPGKFKVGENMLVVDAGGGTSDLCLFKIQSDGGRQSVRMDLLEPVTGDRIGSTHIDDAAEKLLLGQASETNVSDALKIIKTCILDGTIETAKKKLTGVDLEESGTGLPQFSMSKEAMVGFFDEQIRRMQGQIDGVIEDIYTQAPLRAKRGGDTDLHVVLLSGGLGSSGYVRMRLQAQLRKDGGGGFHHNAAGCRVEVSPKPQTCVAQGALLLYQKEMEAKAEAQGDRTAGRRMLERMLRRLRL